MAVVGATFAYFTATNTQTGTGKGNTEVSTATEADLASVTFAQENAKSSNPVWPGTMNFAMAGYKASVEGSSSATKYDITYDVEVSINLDNEFDFPVKWRLYEVDSKSDNAVTCSPVSTTVEGSEIRYTQNCSEDDGTLEIGKKIADGVINKSAECEESESSPTGRISCGQSATYTAKSLKADGVGKDSEKSKYYYLVVEYPPVSGSDQNQNNDMNKTITFSVELKNVATAVATE